MIYSVFVPKEGLYHYYETTQTLPVNADLDVPTLGPDAGKIGVPSMDAARKLPSDARLVGKGWQARGVISSVNGPLSGFGGFGAIDWSSPLSTAVGYGLIFAAGAVVYGGMGKKYTSGARAAAAGAAALATMFVEMRLGLKVGTP